MDSKTYQARVRSMLGEAHDLHQRVAATMTQIGEDAHTAEWQTLYNVMQAVGVACGIMYETLTPRPSALTEADVPMVCTVCRQPVERADAESAAWYHADGDDAEDCPRTKPVKAMVAAGNERVPDSEIEPF